MAREGRYIKRALAGSGKNRIKTSMGVVSVLGGKIYLDDSLAQDSILSALTDCIKDPKTWWKEDSPEYKIYTKFGMSSEITQIDIPELPGFPLWGSAGKLVIVRTPHLIYLGDAMNGDNCFFFSDLPENVKTNILDYVTKQEAKKA